MWSSDAQELLPSDGMLAALPHSCDAVLQVQAASEQGDFEQGCVAPRRKFMKWEGRPGER